MMEDKFPYVNVKVFVLIRVCDKTALASIGSMVLRLSSVSEVFSRTLSFRRKRFVSNGRPESLRNFGASSVHAITPAFYNGGDVAHLDLSPGIFVNKFYYCVEKLRGRQGVSSTAVQRESSGSGRIYSLLSIIGSSLS